MKELKDIENHFEKSLRLFFWDFDRKSKCVFDFRSFLIIKKLTTLDSFDKKYKDSLNKVLIINYYGIIEMILYDLTLRIYQANSKIEREALNLSNEKIMRIKKYIAEKTAHDNKNKSALAIGSSKNFYIKGDHVLQLIIKEKLIGEEFDYKMLSDLQGYRNNVHSYRSKNVITEYGKITITTGTLKNILLYFSKNYKRTDEILEKGMVKTFVFMPEKLDLKDK
jgi:hypothetical protein